MFTLATTPAGSTAGRTRRWRIGLAAVLAVTVAVPVGVGYDASPAHAAPGDLDPTFGTGGIATITLDNGVTPSITEQVAIDASDRFVVAGNTPAGDVVVARFTPDGIPDPTFAGSGVLIRSGTAADENVTGLVTIGTDIYVGYDDGSFSYVVKFDETGVEQWDVEIASIYIGPKLAVNGSGVVVLSAANGEAQVSLVDSSGAVAFETLFTFPGETSTIARDATVVSQFGQRRMVGLVDTNDESRVVQTELVAFAPDQTAVLASDCTSYRSLANVGGQTLAAGYGRNQCDDGGVTFSGALQPIDAIPPAAPRVNVNHASGTAFFDSVAFDEAGRTIVTSVVGDDLVVSRLVGGALDPTFGAGGTTVVGPLPCTDGGTGSGGGVIASTGGGTITIAHACGRDINAVRLLSNGSIILDVNVDIITTVGDVNTLALDLADVDRADVLDDVSLGAVLGSPLRFAPLRFAPLRFAPLRFADFDDPASISAAPLRFAPLRFAGIDTVSVPIVLTEIPIEREGGWEAVLEEIPALRGSLPQTVTIQELVNAIEPGSALDQDLSLGQLDLSGSALAESSVAALLLGGVSVGQLPGDFCTAIGASTGCETSRSLADAELAGLDLDQYYGQLAAALVAGTELVQPTEPTSTIESAPLRFAPLRFAPLRFASLDDSVIGDLDYGQVPTLFDCGSAACDPSLTLAEAQANTATPRLADVTVEELLVAIGELGTGSGITFGDVLLIFVPGDDFPWEQVPFERLVELSDSGDDRIVVVESQVFCTSGDVEFEVVLPDGIPLPDVVTATTSAGPDQDLAITPIAENRFSVLVSSDTCTGAVDDVAIGFGSPSPYRLGSLDYVGIVRIVGSDPSVADVPGVASFGSSSNDDLGTPVPVDEDVIYSAHLGAPGDVDSFTFDLPAAVDGSMVEVSLSHLPEDYDLVVYGPSDADDTAETAPLRFAPLRFASVNNTPIEDDEPPSNQDQIVDPETLEDVPLRFATFRATSLQRGTADEAVQFRVTGADIEAGGEFTIQVSGYNDASSNDPYVLRVKTTSPAADFPCIDRTYTTGSWPSDVSPVSSVDPSTQTLVLWAPERMNRVHGDPTTVTEIEQRLTQYVDRSEVVGEVLAIDAVPAVQTAYDRWDNGDDVLNGPCSIPAANDLVLAINSYVDSVRASSDGLAELRHVVIVGGDEVVPFGRVLDETEIANQESYRFDTVVGGKDNPVSRAFARGYTLSDAPYGDFDPGAFLAEPLYLPDVGVGRLVESPADVLAQLDTYIGNNGLLAASSSQTFAYDFLSDGGTAVADALQQVSPGQAVIDEQWDRQSVVDAWNPDSTTGSGVAAVQSTNAHFDHRRLLPALPNSDGSFGEADLVGVGELPTGLDLFFSMGCNAGVSVADVLVSFGDAPTAGDPTVDDWAQSLAQSGTGTAVLNSGFGYGDSAVVAYGEKLNALFAEELANGRTVGQALTIAKHRYVQELGQSGPYDAKTVHIATFYGLPTFRIGTSSTTAPDVGASIMPPPAPTGPTTVTSTGTFDVDFGASSPTPASLTPEGFWAIEGEPLVTVHHRPIQPSYVTDVNPSEQDPGPDVRARGVLITALESTDTSGVDPVISTPTIDLSLNEQAADPAEAFFPTSLWNLTRTAATGEIDDALVLMPGAFFRDGNGLGIQRIWTRMAGEVLFADGEDAEPPTIFALDIVESPDGGSATFRARTSPDGERALVLYRLQGSTTWASIDLTEGQSGTWSSTISGLGGLSLPKVAEAFIQVPDITGNVGVATFKGRYYESIPEPSSPGGPSISATVSPAPNANGWNNVVPVTVTFQCGADAVSCTDPVEVSSEGVQRVIGEAIDASGEVSRLAIDVGVDLTGPTIVSLPSAQPNDAGWFDSEIEVGFVCSDVLSGVVTCPDAVTIGEGETSLPVESTDRAGNVSQLNETFRIDVTDPTATDVSITPNPKAIEETAVVIATAGDVLSGVAAGEYVVDVGADPGEGNGVPMTFDEDSGQLAGEIGTEIEPGIYELGVRSVDLAGNWSELSTAFLVVYDPAGAFTTGGGWVVPDAAAGDVLPGLDPGDTDRAHFAFSVRYKNGQSTVPQGNASFRYRAGDLDLDSTGFDFLVVTNPQRAIFRGLAEVTVPDGDGGTVTEVMQFQMDVRDLDDAPDEFGIKIWAAEADPDRDDPVYQVRRAPIDGGSIQIQTKQNGKK